MELTFDLIYASLKDENAALRKAYTEQQTLILQLVEALEYHRCQTRPIDRTDDAITAGRAWLEGKPCA